MSRLNAVIIEIFSLCYHIMQSPSGFQTYELIFDFLFYHSSISAKSWGFSFASLSQTFSFSDFSKRDLCSSSILSIIFISHLHYQWVVYKTNPSTEVSLDWKLKKSNSAANALCNSGIFEYFNVTHGSVHCFDTFYGTFLLLYSWKLSEATRNFRCSMQTTPWLHQGFFFSNYVSTACFWRV